MITYIRREQTPIGFKCDCGHKFMYESDFVNMDMINELDQRIARHEFLHIERRKIHKIEMLGPFQLVAYYNPNTTDECSATCTCGWQWKGDESEVLEVCELHNLTHINYIKALNLYKADELSYEGTVNFLVMLGMTEDRAESLMDKDNEG